MRKKTKGNKNEKKDKSPGALFIPAGVLTGMGLGFLFENLPAGLFLGLGIGFIFFAITEIIFIKNR
jgi:hypothetical protein